MIRQPFSDRPEYRAERVHLESAVNAFAEAFALARVVRMPDEDVTRLDAMVGEAQRRLEQVPID